MVLPENPVVFRLSVLVKYCPKWWYEKIKDLFLLYPGMLSVLKVSWTDLKDEKEGGYLCTIYI